MHVAHFSILSIARPLQNADSEQIKQIVETFSPKPTPKIDPRAIIKNIGTPLVRR